MVAFKVLKPFLSKETLEKVHFVKRSGTFGPRRTMDEAFAQVFDDDQLEEEYGGTLSRWGEGGAAGGSCRKLLTRLLHDQHSSNFDFAEYWREETTIWNEWQTSATTAERAVHL